MTSSGASMLIAAFNVFQAEFAGKIEDIVDEENPVDMREVKWSHFLITRCLRGLREIPIWLIDDGGDLWIKKPVIVGSSVKYIKINSQKRPLSWLLHVSTHVRVSVQGGRGGGLCTVATPLYLVWYTVSWSTCRRVRKSATSAPRYSATPAGSSDTSFHTPARSLSSAPSVAGASTRSATWIDIWPAMLRWANPPPLPSSAPSLPLPPSSI